MRPSFPQSPLTSVVTSVQVEPRSWRADGAPCLGQALTRVVPDRPDRHLWPFFNGPCSSVCRYAGRLAPAQLTRRPRTSSTLCYQKDLK